MDESSLRLLDSPVDTPPAVISIIAVPPKCSFPSGTLDITPHPNALSHEVGEGKYTSRGHDIQNAIMGIIDQSMCCPKNFPLCATEATLALSFPLHGPDQKMGIIDQSMCCPKNFPLCATEATLALSFPLHGPDQKTHCPPSTGQDLGRLLQTAHVLSFSKHGPDIRLLATSGEALLQFAKSFCMTPQPTRQTPGIRMAEGQTTYGRLRPVRRPWF